MLILLIAAAAGIALTVILALVGLNLWLAILIGLVVLTALYLVGARIVIGKINVLMETAQKDLQANRPEKAIKVLESGMKYGPWQFFVKGQIKSQIGTIYFLKRDFNIAFDYLQDAFVRNWVAMGMLAVCYMKRSKNAKMTETFDMAVKGTPKEPMLWNLYGFCLEQVGERDKAIAAMEKGLKKVGGHELLEENLGLLKAGKKMQMMEWGELWYQFHLEKQGAIIKKQTKAIQGRRKMVMR